MNIKNQAVHSTSDLWRARESESTFL